MRLSASMKKMVISLKLVEFFGMKGKEGQIVVYKVVGSFFKVLHRGFVAFPDKVHVNG
jgi:hypothetical protein